MSLALGFAISVLAFLVILLGFLFLILHGQIQILDDRVKELAAQISHPIGRNRHEHPEAL